MVNKDFKKQEVHPDFAHLQKQREKEKQNEKEVKVGGKSFVIKKWKNTETLSMLPAFANLLYVPTAALAADKGAEEEGIYVEDPITPATMVKILFEELNNIHFVEFMESMLNQVYIKGKSEPINLDEDIDNPTHIVELMIEVANANFLIGLCQTMYSSTMLMVAAQQVNQNLTKQPE